MAKNYTQKQVLDAIERCNGVMSYVAYNLGCGWDCARRYVHMWDETKEAFDRSECKLHTLAYQSFHRAISNGERWAVERILDTSARRDGHGIVSHAAIDHTSGGERIEGVTVEFIAAQAVQRLPPPPKELPPKPEPPPAKAAIKPEPKPTPKPAPTLPPKSQTQGKPEPSPPVKPKSYRESKRK